MSSAWDNIEYKPSKLEDAIRAVTAAAVVLNPKASRLCVSVPGEFPWEAFVVLDHDDGGEVVTADGATMEDAVLALASKMRGQLEARSITVQEALKRYEKLDLYGRDTDPTFEFRLPEPRP
jgi:hypothetical protein